MVTRIPFAICAFSLPHTMGYLPTKSGEPNARPYSLNDFVDSAVDLELSGVEFPLSTRVPVFDGGFAETASFTGDLPETLQSHNLSFIADYGALLDNDVEHTVDYLKVAAANGARVVRCILSHILCGDRRAFPGGWLEHRNALAERLMAILPAAESLGVALAVENHQDATSDDLLRLHEESGSSSAFGVTLDTGNPLAVCEDPVEYTRRIGHLVRHVHLKDYTIHFAPDGYRLVRCAAGGGVIDFLEILKIVRANGHNIMPAIEIAAQATRTVPMLEMDWWDCYPEEQSQYLPQALRSLWLKGRLANEPYSSCWERGGSSAEVTSEEWRLVGKSVDYFGTLI
jgi:sugar phosphate isomerase/epimerase